VANSKQNSTIFEGFNLGPRGNQLILKPESRKSRDTVPLKDVCFKGKHCTVDRRRGQINSEKVML
jgi:hypothetical protein